MATVSNNRRRTVQVIYLSESSSTENGKGNSQDDLPTLFTNLRHVLLEKSENNNEIDSNIIECVEVISTKIQALTSLHEPTKILDILHEILNIYINELLSINNCTKILSNPRFQEIFRSIVSTEQTFDGASIFTNNNLYARTVCDRSFDLLSLPVIVDFLNDKYPDELFSHLSTVLNLITSRIELSIEYIVFKENELEDQVPKIRLLIDYIDKHKESVTMDMCLTLEFILYFLWNLSDDSMLTPTMIQAKCPEYVLKWISIDSLSINIHRACIHIIHNLARHKQGSEVINSENGINILQEFKLRVLAPNQNNDTKLYTELRLVYCMALSLLSEPKQNKDDLENLRTILDQLMQLTIDCGQSINYKCEGFHVSEPIVVLTKLCVHDEILKYVLKESVVKNMRAKSQLDFFCELLIKFRGALASQNELDQLTLTALFNIIWSISFHSEFVKELKSNSKFLITIKSLANDDGEAWVEQYVPQHMSSISKAAHGILWNLDENNPARTVRSITVPEKKKSDKSDTNASSRTCVMVSYSHADSEFCHQLVDALQKDNRLEIWVDFAYCLTDDLWEEIGQAIEQANVVLFLMSKDYQESKSCRQEVMYAKDSLKKRFIPIYIRKEFVATGWLGVRIVGPQYIRFGKKAFDDTIKELIKLIIEDKRQHGSDLTKLNSPLSNTASPVTNTNNETKPHENNYSKSDRKYLNKPIEHWTKQDISQWFHDNSIPQELEDLYDFQYGIDLLLYGQCLRPDWQLEYDMVKERYEEKFNAKLYRDHFVRFVGAIYRLKSSNSKLCVVS